MPATERARGLGDGPCKTIGHLLVTPTEDISYFRYLQRYNPFFARYTAKSMQRIE